jgi:superfamily I DNA/RNA helicase
MVEAVRAIAQNKALQKRLAARIRHVIVDEYQDVNPIQECIVKLLHDLGAQLCVVGDDDQTIYQWRGSEIKNIRRLVAIGRPLMRVQSLGFPATTISADLFSALATAFCAA